MKMIRHQTEGENLHRLLSLGYRQKLQEGFVILVLMENLGSAIAAINYMVRISWPARVGFWA